jgi:hypothetical protein
MIFYVTAKSGKISNQVQVQLIFIAATIIRLTPDAHVVFTNIINYFSVVNLSSPKKITSDVYLKIYSHVSYLISRFYLFAADFTHWNLEKLFLIFNSKISHRISPQQAVAYKKADTR